LAGKSPDPSQRWRGAAKANYYVPALGFLCGVPFFLVCLYSSNFYVALLLGLLGEYLVAECWFGPYMAAMQVFAPSSPFRGCIFFIWPSSFSFSLSSIYV
jgi:hypothetical protein